MRHAPFAVTPDMRDRWITHMRDAVESIDVTEAQRTEMWTYLERAAQFMVNTEGPSPATTSMGGGVTSSISLQPRRPDAS